MEIRDIRSTELFTGAAQRPCQLLRVTLVNRGEWLAGDSEVVTVRADGPGVSTPEPAVVTGLGPGEERSTDVPLAIDAAYAEGTARRVTVLAEGAAKASAIARNTLARIYDRVGLLPPRRG